MCMAVGARITLAEVMEAYVLVGYTKWQCWDESANFHWSST